MTNTTNCIYCKLVLHKFTHYAAVIYDNKKNNVRSSSQNLQTTVLEVADSNYEQHGRLHVHRELQYSVGDVTIKQILTICRQHKNQHIHQYIEV